MHEYIVNLHMHTPYSDGHGTHAEIAAAALEAGLDAVIVTDHNVLVQGLEGYYGDEDKRVLLLVGEEVHDQLRQPQKSHLLVLGTEREMAQLAEKPQRLIDEVNKAGGMSFLAHPIDPAAPAFGEEDLSWVDWEVQDYTGIELWNGLSEFKSLMTSRLRGGLYAYNPARIARGPFAEALAKWDELLSNGKKVVAIGGSDAHAIPARMGPLRRTIFPYDYHFRAVNTHVFTPKPLSGDFVQDKRMILEALRQGHAFIGYDLPAPTRGFRFTAHQKDSLCWMGDEVSSKAGVTLQVHLPQAAECRLLKDGELIRESAKRNAMAHAATEPGVYRVEAYIHYKGRRRGWIFSNPIYVR